MFLEIISYNYVTYQIFRFNRGSQTFTIPLQLSQEVLPSAVFYATIAPVLAYFVVDRLILQPFARSEQER
jgi:DnaJ family protein C protein 11